MSEPCSEIEITSARVERFDVQPQSMEVPGREARIHNGAKAIAAESLTPTLALSNQQRQRDRSLNRAVVTQDDETHGLRFQIVNDEAGWMPDSRFFIEPVFDARL